MFKCPLQTADNFKAKAGPKFHGAFVCADDKIELHGAKAALLARSSE